MSSTPSLRPLILDKGQEAMVADGTLSFEAVFFDSNRWYELDTLSVLTAAENLSTRSLLIINRSLMVIKPKSTHA